MLLTLRYPSAKTRKRKIILSLQKLNWFLYQETVWTHLNAVCQKRCSPLLYHQGRNTQIHTALKRCSGNKPASVLIILPAMFLMILRICQGYSNNWFPHLSALGGAVCGAVPVDPFSSLTSSIYIENLAVGINYMPTSAREPSDRYHWFRHPHKHLLNNAIVLLDGLHVNQFFKV